MLMLMLKLAEHVQKYTINIAIIIYMYQRMYASVRDILDTAGLYLLILMIIILAEVTKLQHQHSFVSAF